MEGKRRKLRKLRIIGGETSTTFMHSVHKINTESRAISPPLLVDARYPHIPDTEKNGMVPDLRSFLVVDRADPMAGRSIVVPVGKGFPRFNDPCLSTICAGYIGGTVGFRVRVVCSVEGALWNRLTRWRKLEASFWGVREVRVSMPLQASKGRNVSSSRHALDTQPRLHERGSPRCFSIAIPSPVIRAILTATSLLLALPCCSRGSGRRK